MRKSFTILLALVLAFFTVPFGGVTALAEEVDSVTAEKAYKIDYTILQENGSQASTADEFFEKPAILLEYEGNKYIQMTTKSAEMIKSFSNEYGNYVLVEESGDEKTIQLKVPKDLTDLKVNMHISVPGLYDTTHDAILTFGSTEKVGDPENYSLITSKGENGPSIEKPEPTEPENPGEEDNDSGENDSDKSKEVELSTGSYIFDVSYIRSDKDSPSSMGNYLGESIFVDVKNGKPEVTITVTDKESVTKLQLGGKDPVEVVEDGENRYERFLLDGLSETIGAYVEYQAPYGDGVWKGDASFRVSLDIDSKEKVESKDKPGSGLLPTPKEEELSLKDGFYTANVVYYHAEENKESAMARYLGDKVSIAVENDEVEITVTVNDNNSVTLLKIEGEEPLEVVKNGEQNYETFKVEKLKNIYKGYTEYQAPYGDSIFEGKAQFRIIIDQESIEKLSEEKEFELALGEKVSVEKDSILVIDSKKGTELKLPSNLPEGVTLTVSEAEGFEKSEDLKPAGDILNFDFNGLGNQDYNFELTMHFDAESFNPDEYDLDIYYYDAETGEWIAQNGEVRDGSVTVSVEHFSIYGLFAKEKEAATEDPKEDPKEEPGKETETDEETKLDSLTPDKVYEVIYEILHEDGNAPSVANHFFEKPGYILEKDGVKYIQITITDGEYVKALSNEYGDALIVKENPDGSVVLQLKLHDDLSNMLLDMHIVVGAGAIPGFPGYDAEHQAILFIDKDSLKEIDLADHLLAGTGDENNENGPFLKDQPKPDPEKPEFDDETEKEETEEIDLTPKTEDQDERNPQTGVKTNLLLYTSLLLASLIPLAVQLRRRFA